MKQIRSQIISYAAAVTLFFAGMTCFAQNGITSKTDTERASLKITANIADASVYLNNSYAGTTPLTVTDLVPGTYRITVKKSGYETKDIYADIAAGTEKSFYLELKRITGILKVSASPANALIIIDGEQKSSSSAASAFELPEGSHSVEVRAFGYKAERQTAVILRNTVTKIDVKLKKADFSASSIYISPDTFNPQNPGVFGTCNLNFSVTAPGSGTIVISKDDQIIKTIHMKPFKTWSQTYSWNGQSDSGSFVPDGTYTATAELNGQTAAGEPVQTISSAPVTINRSISYPFTSISASGTGTGLVPSPVLYPAQTMLLAWKAGFEWQPGKTLQYRVPLMMHFMHTPLSWLEYSIQADMSIPEDGEIPLRIGGAVKAAYSSGAFKAGALLRYGYNTVQTAVSGTEAQAGLGLGLTAGFTLSAITVNASSECIFGPEQGIVTNGSICWKNGLALRFNRGSFSGGIWGTVFSAFNTEKTQAQHWFRGTSFGADVSYVIPNTFVMLGLQGSGTICPEYAARIAVSLECSIFLR